MCNVIDMSKESVKVNAKQGAKWVILTLKQIMGSEQNIIDDMEAILEGYNNSHILKELNPEHAEKILKEFDVEATEKTNEAIDIVDALAEVLHKYDLLTANTFSNSDIRKQYKELKDNE